MNNNKDYTTISELMKDPTINRIFTHESIVKDLAILEDAGLIEVDGYKIYLSQKMKEILQ